MNFFLVVRFWVAPDAEAQVLRWLEGGHVAEVSNRAPRSNADLKRKFALERAPFESRMRIERFAGEVDRSWE